VTTATLVGFNVPGLISAAGALPVGQQKAKYCTDVAALLGTNPIFEIAVGTTVKYRSTVMGTLANSSAGVVIPVQFVEPPSVNLADALTGSNCVVIIRNASNSSVYASVPIKLGGGTGFVTASLALDGTRLVRTSSFRLTPPPTLDVSGGSAGTTTYSKQELINDMTLPNENGWGIAQAPNTHTGTTNTYAQITVAINRTDGDSGYPNAYLSDATLRVPTGTVTLTNTTAIKLMGSIVVGRGSGSLTRSINSRVQIRGHKLIAYLRNGLYQTLASRDDGILTAVWQSTFVGGGLSIPTEQGVAVYQARIEPVGNGGGQSLGSIGSGNWGLAFDSTSNSNRIRYEDFMLHSHPIEYVNTRQWWVDNVRAVLEVLEARLIVHDPSGTDDRANANLMIWSASNWYANDVYVVDGAGVGRVKLIPSNGAWRTFSWSSIPITTLNTNPPPGWS
jgi:hypothetical protein